MKLIRWLIKENRLCGAVVGSDRYSDHTYIETSEIKTAAFDGSDFLIKTANSVYECCADDFEGGEEALEQFILQIAQEIQRDSTRKIKQHPENSDV